MFSHPQVAGSSLHIIEKTFAIIDICSSGYVQQLKKYCSSKNITILLRCRDIVSRPFARYIQIICIWLNTLL